MKIAEFYGREQLSGPLGLVWRTTSPTGVVAYQGKMTDLAQSNGVYSISLIIAGIKGRVSRGYDTLKPGETLDLSFGPGADIEFYRDAREGQMLYRRALRGLRKTFSRETVDRLEKIKFIVNP